MRPLWFREPQIRWEPNRKREPDGTLRHVFVLIPGPRLVVGSGNQREPRVAHRFPVFPPLKGGTGTSADFSGPRR
jgi:hypothetical protein